MFKEVPRAGKHVAGDVRVAGEASLELHGKVDVLEAGEVGGTGGRSVLRVEGERVHVHGNIGDVRVPLPRLHLAVVGGFTALLAHGRVEAELSVVHGVLTEEAGVGEPQVGLFSAGTAEDPDQLNDGVRELKAHVVEVVLELEVLVLGDEGVEGSHGETVTLLHVKVDVADVHPCLEVAGLDVVAGLAVDHDAIFTRHDDAVGELLEANRDLGLGVKHGHGGEGLTGGHGVEEGKRHVQVALELRIVDEVLAGVPLANHLGQTLTGLARKLLPDEQEIRVQQIHNLVANDDCGLAHEQLANGVGPVSPEAGALGALFLLANVAAELVAGLVHAEHVVVDARLEAHGLGRVTRVGVLKEEGLVLIRASEIAVTGHGVLARATAAVDTAGVAGGNAGQLNHDVSEVDKVGSLTDVGATVGGTEAHASELVGESLGGEGRVLTVAATPKSHHGVAVEENPNTDTSRSQLGLNTTRGRSDTTS